MAAWATIPARYSPQSERLYLLPRSLVRCISTLASRAAPAPGRHLSPVLPGYHQPALLAWHGYSQYLADAECLEACLSEANGGVKLCKRCVVNGTVRSGHRTPVRHAPGKRLVYCTHCGYYVPAPLHRRDFGQAATNCGRHLSRFGGPFTRLLLHLPIFCRAEPGTRAPDTRKGCHYISFGEGADADTHEGCHYISFGDGAMEAPLSLLWGAGGISCWDVDL